MNSKFFESIYIPKKSYEHDQSDVNLNTIVTFIFSFEYNDGHQLICVIQGFAIQLNKNSFGLSPANPLNVPILNANQTLGMYYVPISYVWICVHVKGPHERPWKLGLVFFL